MREMDLPLVGLAIALGIGLLIGADRERRKGEGTNRAAAGLRTFAVASLAGAVSFHAGGEILLATVTAGTIAFAALSYWRSRADDPGLTTEIALVLTTLLGALAMAEPMLAAGVGVLVAGLLHARGPLHGFVRSVLSEADLRDALIFAGATLIVLPLLPDRQMGPFEAINPHRLWLIVILVMTVSTVGYVMTRIVGARYGLPLAGLASGFVSSVATIAAMGARAEKAPELLRPAAAGAVLSTVATILQMVVVLAATSIAALEALALPLACAGAAAVLYGAGFTLWALRAPPAADERTGRAFSLHSALAFGALLGAIVLASAAFGEWFGSAGLLVAAAVGGLADAHATAVSVASLVAADRLAPEAGVVPILVALTANTLAKLLVAVRGGRRFALAVVPGIVLVVAMAWLGALP